jgi:hypothetical protein
MLGRVRDKAIETRHRFLHSMGPLVAALGVMTSLFGATGATAQLEHAGAMEEQIRRTAADADPFRGEPRNDRSASHEWGRVLPVLPAVQSTWWDSAVHLRVTARDGSFNNRAAILEDVSDLIQQDSISTAVITNSTVPGYFFDQSAPSNGLDKIKSLFELWGPAILLFISKEAFDIVFGPVKDEAKEVVAKLVRRLVGSGAQAELRTGKTVIALYELNQEGRERATAAVLAQLETNEKSA